MLIVTNFTATHVIFLLFHKLPLLRFPQTLKVPWEAEIGPVGLFDALLFTQTNRVQLGFRCKNGDVHSLFYYCEVPLEPGWEMSAWIIVPHAIFHLAASRDDTGVRDLFYASTLTKWSNKHGQQQSRQSVSPSVLLLEYMWSAHTYPTHVIEALHITMATRPIKSKSE